MGYFDAVAPRSIWNGTVSLGLVNVPIKLYTATESKTVHFQEVHARDGSRIEHRRVCPRRTACVPFEEIVRGYEVSPGKYVVLDKREVKAAAGDRGKLIELSEFVDAAEIDPVFFDKTYYVGSGDDKDAYRLLHEALRRTGPRRDRALQLPRPRVPRRDPRARRRDRAAHPALPRRGRRQRRPRAGRAGRKPSKAEVDMAKRLVDSLRASSTRRSTRTPTARRCSS